MQAAVGQFFGHSVCGKEAWTQQAFGVLRAFEGVPSPTLVGGLLPFLVARLGAECGALAGGFRRFWTPQGGSIARIGKPQWLVEFTPMAATRQNEGITRLHAREAWGCGFSVYVWFSLFFICLCSFLRMIPIYLFYFHFG